LKKSRDATPSAEAAIALVSSISNRTKSELAPTARSLIKEEHEKQVVKGVRLQETFSEGSTLVVKGKEISLGHAEQPRSAVVTNVSKVHPSDVVSLIDGVKYGIVDPKIGDMRNSFLTHSVYYLALIGAGVATALVPSTVAAIGALSMGTLGVGANFKNFQDSADKFLNDRRKLVDSFEIIDLLRGSNDSFPGGVQEAYDSVMKYLSALTQSDGQPQK
jgi:hypothetical protein